MNFFLDLRDKNKVMDFLVAYLPLADATTQKKTQKMITSAETISTGELSDAARALAIRVWPVRFAVAHLIEKTPDAEWKIVASACRPQTAAHLEKLKKMVHESQLSSLLARSEVDAVLSEDEKLEIESVRHEAMISLAGTQQKELAEDIKHGKKEMEEYLERFTALRELAGSLPEVLQREAFSKVTHYEDRILYKGEAIAPQILDEEVAYYRGQKEISPLED